MEVEAGFWQCAACTFANRDLRAARCDGWVKRASLLETWQQVTGSLAVSRPIKLTCCGPR